MYKKSVRHHSMAILIFLAVLFLVALPLRQARADELPLDAASNYAVLYEGTGGHNLSISNVTVNGNVGVGGTGVVQFSGPGTIGGELDFSASNSGQYHNTNGSNVGPTSVNYGVGNVTSALSTVNSLSTTLGGATATNLAISGTQTINASSGSLDVIGGHNYLVFNITAYTENDGKLLTINGAGGDIVVFNFGTTLGDVNLGGDVKLSGLTGDQVLWNFTSSGNNVQLNNNASSYPTLFYQGDILAPNDKISLVNANLDGRVFGGDSSDMQIVSGDTINSPSPTPEPSTLILLATALLGFVGLAAWRKVRLA